MRLNVSKRIIKAGEILEVTWDCEECTDPHLILQTGNRESVLSVPPSGTKRFRMKGSVGKHSVGLRCNLYGKEKTTKKRILVYGKVKDTDEFEYVDRGDASPMSRWNQGIQNWWASYTPEKKRLYILLLLLLAIHMLSSIPSFAFLSNIIFYVTIFWLFWQVVKK